MGMINIITAGGEERGRAASSPREMIVKAAPFSDKGRQR